MSPDLSGDPLATYLLRLADDNLILAQQLGGLVSHMPDLELDIAVANIGLDHLGQARALLAYAAERLGDGRDEDDLAMGRDERQFLNAVLVERPNGDFAATLTRQLLVDAYQVPLYESLGSSSDERLGAIAAKAAKEARYHLAFSSSWMVRLGDGTAESHRRAQVAIDDLWPFSADLFAGDDVEDTLRATGVAPDPAPIRARFDQTVAEVLGEATLELPDGDYQRLGGRTGFHTESLGHLLPEMQSLHRSHPGATW